MDEANGESLASSPPSHSLTTLIKQVN
ncbi:uncharacterized protein METZ01_LOCUS251916 [marine metagenome]|uniref:Uncharacterized protein n=1 Tax=marine metagenome TaxID=408172 RepID=A0A382IIG3_9ZZZZ